MKDRVHTLKQRTTFFEQRWKDFQQRLFMQPVMLAGNKVEKEGVKTCRRK